LIHTYLPLGNQFFLPTGQEKFLVYNTYPNSADFIDASTPEQRTEQTKHLTKDRLAKLKEVQKQAFLLKKEGLKKRYNQLSKEIELKHAKDLLKEELNIEDKDIWKLRGVLKKQFESSQKIFDSAAEVLNKSMKDILNSGRSNLEKMRLSENLLTKYLKKAETQIKSENIRIWNEAYKNTDMPSYEEASHIIARIFISSPEDRTRRKKIHKNVIDRIAKEKNDFKLNADFDSYVKKKADWILEEQKDNPENFKKNLGRIDPFAEVIAFVNDTTGKAKLSVAAIQALKNIQNEHLKKKYTESLKKKHKKIANAGDREKNEDNKKAKILAAQGKLMQEFDLYQLGMMNIAERAEAKILKEGGVDSPENLSTEEKKEVLISRLTDMSESDPKTIRAVLDSPALGHIVSHSKTNEYTQGATPLIDGEKVDLENLFIYEVVGTWGILTVIANLLVIINGGNIEESLLYLSGGLGAAWFATKAVKDGIIDKWRNPENMPKWIMKEGDNTFYEQYFKNEYEIALLQNMRWPQEKGGQKDMKKAIKEIPKRAIKTHNETIESGKIVKKDSERDAEKQPKNHEKISFLDREARRSKRVIYPDDFSDGAEGKKDGPLAKYLPNVIVLPSGKRMGKNEFLSQLEKNGGGGSRSSSANQIRYVMMLKILGRIGANDDFLPHLHTLHQYAKDGKPNKTNAINVPARETPKISAKTVPPTGYKPY
jgi:hypothetical protein